MAVTSTSPVAPSQSVDVAWHHFILFTRDYAAYCNRYLGRYIHHHPTGKAKAMSGPMRRRAPLEATFGSIDEELWSRVRSADCKEGGKCKSDCTGDCSSS